jgi:hypothetical protein
VAIAAGDAHGRTTLSYDHAYDEAGRRAHGSHPAGALEQLHNDVLAFVRDAMLAS